MRPGLGLRGRRALIRRGSRGGGGLPAPAGCGWDIRAGTRSRRALTRSRLSSIRSLPTRRRPWSPFSKAFLMAEPRRATRPFWGCVASTDSKSSSSFCCLVGALQAGALLVEVENGAGAPRRAAPGLLWRSCGPLPGSEGRRGRHHARGGGRGCRARTTSPPKLSQSSSCASPGRRGDLGSGGSRPGRRRRRRVVGVLLLVGVEELAATVEQLLGPGGVPAGAVARSVSGAALGRALGARAVAVAVRDPLPVRRRRRAVASPESSGSPDSVREADRPRSTSKSKSKSSVM